MLNAAQLTGYSISKLVHRGKHSLVYRAIRDSDGKPVILKGHAAEYPNALDLAILRHEHGLLSGLDIPGVPRALALETSYRGLFLVMEVVDAEPLSAMLARGKPTLMTTLRIACALVDILSGIHHQKIIHKDINPNNVLVDPGTGEVHVIDFSISSRLSQETLMPVNPEALEGTLAYIAPEQTGRMNRTIDERSDLYSVGVMLYEMLTGRRPFQTLDPMELLFSHLARTPVPPAELSPDVPSMLSALTMKLLAKAAENRYQTARGLFLDLSQCLRQLEQTGQIERFTLGRRDLRPTLRIPQKIYGREDEMARLSAAFERTAGGGAELCLVSGYAGVGKSVLVNEIHKFVAHQGGYFASGKFDQLRRGVPYSSIARAFGDIARQILSEKDASIAHWKELLSSALGPNASVLVELVPEFSLVLGPQPPAASLGPMESQARLFLVAQRFLSVLCTKEHPIALFLDDLQWADAASLSLLEAILTDPERGYFLVIGAFRDNEVSPDHLLLRSLELIKKGGVPTSTIELRPLSSESIELLLADTLGRSREDIAPLARLVSKKTQGNPFFINQLLTMLSVEGQISFDAAAGRFQWNMEAIAAHDVTDNVVELMVSRLRKLEPRTQEVVTLAACIGHRFDLRMLSVIAESTPAAVARALWPALDAGLILPLDSEYRLVLDVDPADAENTAFEVSYRFLHDRVQQAAYSLIEEPRRRATHLRLGRLMLASQDEIIPDELLFAIVGHLNQGVQLVEDAGERLRLAELNQRAGSRAIGSSAYAAAAELFRMGLVALGADPWRGPYDLTFAIHVGLAESEYLCGRFAEAEALFTEMLGHIESELDKAAVSTLWLKLVQVAGRYDEGVTKGFEALVPLGVCMPSTEDEHNRAVSEELAWIKEAMAGREIAELESAPLLSDEGIRAIINLLAEIAPCAYIGRPQAFPLVALKMVSLSLRHGNTESSCFGYSIYGLMLASAFGDIPSGYAFSEMSIRLNQRFGDIKLRGTLLHLHGDHINFWKRPLKTDLPILEEAFLACQEAGDLVYASYLAFETVWQLYEMGEPLADVYASSHRYAAFARKIRNEAVYDTICIEQRFFSVLERGASEAGLLSDESFDEVACIERIRGASFGCGVAFYHMMRAILHYTFGRPEESLAEMKEMEPILGAIMAMPSEATYFFYRGLARLSCAASGPEEARQSAIARAEDDIVRLALWAEHCPANFLHRHLLLLAERARAEGRDAEAMDLYDRAASAARESGMVHEEALANELAGRYYAARGRARIAGFYLSAAVAAYTVWGARAKVEWLCASNCELIPASSLDIHSAPPDALSSRGITERLFDATTVLRTTEAIASEIELDRTLEQVMRAVVQSAGAQRGAFVLPRDKGLQIAARMTIEPERIEVGTWEPLEASEELAVSVVHYVARSSEALVLGDAANDERFVTDPYVISSSPRSILCLPLSHRGRLSGVLYLENNAAVMAFTTRHTELLSLLAKQIAIAVENALLYDRVQRVSLSLRTANDELEQEVRRRTEELEHANARLLVELRERELAERERVALQEEIITVQKERLKELSTPMIPISSGVMVMPLVGSVDRDRAEQVLETALHGASTTRAQVVILDITGIREVDADVAGTLARTAGALRLLGTEATLTGVRPEVAQLFVELGVDLRGLSLCSTLEAGVSRALARKGSSSRQVRQ